MAAAETARLIASLELQDKNFTRGIRNVERGVGRVDKKLSAFGGFVNRNLARGIDRAAASLVDGVFAGVESLQELEVQQAQTNAVIKSTGGIAGVTADKVTELSEKYEGLNATIGDEVVRSGENMLLTFRNINKDAFEPALAAGLDMNTALGKGPEGLTSTMLKLGKALNDPSKGLTALGRAGVQFTKGQVKKIKSLQKEGKLYEAQQIILKELNKEFGGSFAAQGDTTAGKVAKFHDAVEDLQRTFAKALLPIIVKVADKLGTFLADPAVVKGIEQAGEALGAAFDGVLAAAEKINWAAIGNGLRIAADFAGQLVGWFGKIPDWAQALLVGGLVATKLPVIGDLISELGKGLIKGVLGMTAGVVNLKAATVVGGPGGLPGAPVPGGKGGGLFGGIGKLAFGLTSVGLTALFAEFIHEDITGPLAKQLQKGILGGPLIDIELNDLQWPFGPKNTPTILPDIFGGNGLLGGTPAPVPARGGDRPSPGNPGIARNALNLKPVTAAQMATTNAVKNAQSIASRENSAQKAELGNVKSAVATLDANQRAASVAQIATTVVGQIQQAAAATTAAINAAAAATAIRTGTANTTTAARIAGTTTANAMSVAASRIVGAVNALDLNVNVTTVNRTSTVNNRYGPTSGSSQGSRIPGAG